MQDVPCTLHHFVEVAVSRPDPVRTTNNPMDVHQAKIYTDDDDDDAMDVDLPACNGHSDDDAMDVDTMPL